MAPDGKTRCDCCLSGNAAAVPAADLVVAVLRHPALVAHRIAPPRRAAALRSFLSDRMLGPRPPPAVG